VVVGESPKLAHTDALLRRLEGCTLLFAFCPEACSLLHRLLVFRRLPHAHLPPSLPPDARAARLSSVRSSRSHVILLEAPLPSSLGLKAHAAVFFDQHPSLRETLSSLRALTPPPKIFHLVSSAWEEANATLAEGPPLADLTLQLLAAEKERAGRQLSR
ncbi:MAG: hypothetical protein SGPRY_010086, partial [Prymnesium sp.]